LSRTNGTYVGDVMGLFGVSFLRRGLTGDTEQRDKPSNSLAAMTAITRIMYDSAGNIYIYIYIFIRV